MQVYQVPYNYDHEEKIFGGYTSLRQAIYLIFIVSSLGIFLIPKIDIILKFIFVFMIAGIFLTFAFAKIEGAYADKYFIYIFKYVFRRKIYILER